MTIIGTPYRICSDIARVPMPAGLGAHVTA